MAMGRRAADMRAVADTRAVVQGAGSVAESGAAAGERSEAAAESVAAARTRCVATDGSRPATAGVAAAPAIQTGRRIVRSVARTPTAAATWDRQTAFQILVVLRPCDLLVTCGEKPKRLLRSRDAGGNGCTHQRARRALIAHAARARRTDFCSDLRARRSVLSNRRILNHH